MSTQRWFLLLAIAVFGCVVLFGCPAIGILIAAFTASPLVGPAPLTVNFEEQSVVPVDQEITYAWTFGDGGSSTEPNPNHLYESPGSYTVTLTVSSETGSDTITKSHLIHVTEPTAEGEPDGTFVVLAYNDLGMHCMNRDFSELMILPPYNTLRAQVIDRRGEEPHIRTSGVTVAYAFPNNTTSSDKTNFWDFVDDLLAVTLPPDMGLTGNGLAGAMTPSGANDWWATGIPITPLDDDGVEDPYPLATVTVRRGDALVARTHAVTPVSWEISCDLCHGGGGVSTDTDILQAHDRLHDTDLESRKPVLCAECHAQAPLGTVGSPSLSHAMHGAHASRMHLAGLEVDCYACHPGIRTQCLRDVHAAAGMVCMDCHGGMVDVADPTRAPWADEPRCDDCHSRAGFAFEQPGTLYRESKGHHGVHCAACHGSPHAITPTTKPVDNVQAIEIQGFAGTIRKCSVCHSQSPGDDPFDHRFEGDEGEDENGEED